MRKNIAVLLSLFFVVMLTERCGAKSHNTLVVHGNISIGKTTAVELFSVQDGEWIEVAKTMLDSSGNYRIVVEQPVGELWAVAPASAGRFDRPYKARFYASKGGDVELNATEKWEKYDFGKKPSSQNRYLREWVTLYDGMFPRFALNTYKEVFPKIDSYLANAEALVKKVKTKDKRFNEWMKFYVNAESKYSIIEFRYMPNSVHPTEEEVPAIYKQLYDATVFDSPSYSQLPFVSRWIDILMMYYSKSEKDIEQTSEKILSERIKYEPIKGIWFVSKLSSYSSYESFATEYEMYKSFITSDNQRNKIEKYITENKSLAKGAPAFNFTFADRSGKMVSLSDFKGKVVVVDVWATWCAPCRAQIPHLQKLEHEYADNSNVVFIAVSTDSQKDKGKWEAMIDDMKMGGIQLHAPKADELRKNYKITGIPRFMVFDKQGNIVSASAPRPSDPALKLMIESELKR